MMPNRKIERTFWENGQMLVAGIDEVGRGALAGPVVAAAIVLPQRCKLSMVRDSKLMTPKARFHAAMHIKRQAIAIGIGWASNHEIDKYGLTWAVRQSGIRAISDVKSATINAVILDGNYNYLKETHNSVTIIKADQSCLCVAAASVIAKVTRDNYMELLARAYPQYGFESHKGYGTNSHWQALKDAITPAHRQLFLRKWKALSVN
jgi:ribonuclease HII